MSIVWSIWDQCPCRDRAPLVRRVCPNTGAVGAVASIEQCYIRGGGERRCQLTPSPLPSSPFLSTNHRPHTNLFFLLLLYQWETHAIDYSIKWSNNRVKKSITTAYICLLPVIVSLWIVTYTLDCSASLSQLCHNNVLVNETSIHIVL